MIHPLAWLIWLAAQLAVLSVTRNPLYMLLAIACTAAVLLRLRDRAATAPAVPLSPLRFGLVVLPLAALFNALTVHIGRTVLLRLPAALPLLGGPITLEALTFGALNGLALTGIYAAFVVFHYAVPVRALVGLIPRAFFPVAVVTSIALTFVPVTLRQWQQVREAQAVRGHRIRGLRDWLPLFLPLLIGGLEHAFQLAEAMTARGFAGTPETARTRRARAAIAAGLVSLLAGWLLRLVWQQHALGVPLMVLGGGMVVTSLWWLGRQVPRTTYRPRRWHARDSAIALASAIAAAACLVAWPGWERSTLFFYPYPAVTLPGFSMWIALALGGLLLPAVLIPPMRRPSLPERPARPCYAPTGCCCTGRPRGDGHPIRHRPGHRVSCRSAPPVESDRRSAMITFRDVRYTYPGATQPVLRHVDFHLPEATFALVVGRSGAGKSTLLRCVNGLVPHFSGGTFAGRLAVAGLDPLCATPRVMSRYVGFVFQNPEAQFVLDRVEDEIAFALENAAMPRQEMRVRVEEVLDLLDLAALRERPLETLSGGERQRVAIAAALAFRPRVLVLDEPTSQLDPQSAEDVLNALVRLNHDLGLTVLLAEHRLERVLQYADHVIALPDAPEGANGVLCGATREVLPRLELLPPLVALAKQLNWQPLPLTTKEGLGFSRPLAERLPPAPPAVAPVRQGAVGLALQRVRVRYAQQPVLRDLSLEVRRGEILVLMGRNGSGKTTLLKTLVGLVRPESGEVWVDGQEVTGEDVATICRRVGYLPQEADALLFADTVRQELAITLHNHGLPEHAETMDALLAQLGLAAHAGRYPRDLSVGERQRVALGAITVTQPAALLLDEPTRGLDYAAKEALSALLRRWRDAGMAILVVTHDVEFAARIADRVALLSQGELIAEGAPAEVLGASPLFAPQMARLFPGRGWLTVEDALRGLGGSRIGSLTQHEYPTATGFTAEPTENH